MSGVSAKSANAISISSTISLFEFTVSRAALDTASSSSPSSSPLSSPSSWPSSKTLRENKGKQE